MSVHLTSRPIHDQALAAGKLPSALLARLFTLLPTTDDALLLGPSVGEDAAVIDLNEVADDGDRLLVVKSDPVTFATDAIGHYVVNVCANDLAVTGATPHFFLPTVLLPAATATMEMVLQIFEQIGVACRRAGVVVAGGHSEVTHAVNQPIVAGTMLGRACRQHLVSTGGCAAGDLILLAGAAPIEGASIIARERRAQLLADGWSPTDLAEAANYLFNPGISVMVPALAAAERHLVSAMHDPTEGGVITGLRELALAADAGLSVDLDAIPVPSLARRLCVRFGLDPLGAIASGALLATCAPSQQEALLQVWQDLGWTGTVIGQVTDRANGLVASRQGRQVAFPHFAADEITKLFGP